MVTAAVVLDSKRPIAGLADSKKLTERQRLRLYHQIIQYALAWQVGRAEAQEIDQLNILQARMLAMQRAVAGLNLLPAWVLVDGSHCPSLPMPVQAVVRGDSRVAEICAASIVAKVTRDAEMVELDRQFPQYGFARHKGYPTVHHMQRLLQWGVTPHHRRSFSPVKRQLQGADSPMISSITLP